MRWPMRFRKKSAAASPQEARPVNGREPVRDSNRSGKTLVKALSGRQRADAEIDPAIPLEDLINRHPAEATTVVSLFKIVLGRLPDASGYNYYLRELLTGRPVRNIAHHLLVSEEYRSLDLPPQWWVAACRNVREPEVRPRRLQSRAAYCCELARRPSVYDFCQLLAMSAPDSCDAYQVWIGKNDIIDDAARRLIRQHMQRFVYRPLISVVMPVYNTPETFLRAAIQSVIGQLYGNWELCIANDASTAPHVMRVLDELAATDSRIKVAHRSSNGHVSAATNTALELATGEFIALLDHDDILAETALYEVASVLDQHADTDIVYSDEDRINDAGQRSGPYFKPDFDLDLFLAQNFINHLGVYRRTLVATVGGFRLGYEGSQDYDLALRCVAQTSKSRIRHIPAILYHWRASKDHLSISNSQLGRCVDAARRAKADFLKNSGGADVVANPKLPTAHRVLWPRPSPAPLVSIIVPTKNGYRFLKPCIDGLLDRTHYPAIELIIIDHESSEPDTLALLEELRRRPDVRVMPYSGPFNYADMNNRGVALARGELICLLNNDVDVINSDWLDEMVALAVRPTTGVVGAKLLYPDGSIQHAGVALGLGGAAGHTYSGSVDNANSYFGRLAHVCQVSAVTGACMVMRKEHFTAVGGFNALDLPVTFNDIDLCLRVRQAGFDNVWTPFAVIYHHESPSRGPDHRPQNRDRARREIDYFKRTWGEQLLHDPFFNENLSLDMATIALAAEPRRIKPWLRAEHREPEQLILTKP